MSNYKSYNCNIALASPCLYNIGTIGPHTIRKANKIQQQQYAARTGFVVDIQKIGSNKKLIAIKQKYSHKKIRAGVWLRKSSRTFTDNNFTNIYDFYWDSSTPNVTPHIHSSNSPYSLYEQVAKDTSTIGAINGSFYFLADIADRTPHELSYNFCVREGKIRGLPSVDKPIIYTKNKQLKTFEPKARGYISIGSTRIKWIGANSSINNEESVATLFNSYSSNIIKVRDKKTNVQIGIVDTHNITTPKNPRVSDILVSTNENNELVVSGINVGGGTHFYAGVFILQVKGDISRYKIGDKVIPHTLDGLQLNTISSGISVGKRISKPLAVHKSHFKRDARSIIAKDIQNNIHFVVYDGSKYIPGFNGVSLVDIHSTFNSKKYKWAYFLDGGGSSRIILKKNDMFKFYANEFAFRKMENGKHLWDWRNARSIASSIALKMHGTLAS